jgi:hypothetical protein
MVSANANGLKEIIEADVVGAPKKGEVQPNHASPLGGLLENFQGWGLSRVAANKRTLGVDPEFRSGLKRHAAVAGAVQLLTAVGSRLLGCNGADMAVCQTKAMFAIDCTIDHIHNEHWVYQPVLKHLANNYIPPSRSRVRSLSLKTWPTAQST